MSLISLPVGELKIMENLKVLLSRIFIYQNAFINTLGLSENEIADTKNHGGVFKAIFANATSNYKLGGNFG